MQPLFHRLFFVKRTPLYWTCAPKVALDLSPSFSVSLFHSSPPFLRRFTRGLSYAAFGVVCGPGLPIFLFHIPISSTFHDCRSRVKTMPLSRTLSSAEPNQTARLCESHDLAGIFSTLVHLTSRYSRLVSLTWNVWSHATDFFTSGFSHGAVR